MSQLTDQMNAALANLEGKLSAAGVTADEVTTQIHTVVDPQITALNATIATITSSEADDATKIADLTAAVTEFTTAFAPAAPVVTPAPAPRTRCGTRTGTSTGGGVMLLDILIIFALFALFFGGVGTAPVWEHSAGFGYGPSGFMFVLFVILLVYVIRGRGSV